MPSTPGLLIATARRRIKQVVLDRVAEHRLTPQQFWMLVAIREAPGISQVEISARTRDDPPSVSRALSSLCDRGLVRTHVDPGDRRRTLVRLTPAGRRLTAVLLPIARGLRERVVAGMSEAEVASLCALLKRVIANLDDLERASASRASA